MKGNKAWAPSQVLEHADPFDSVPTGPASAHDFRGGDGVLKGNKIWDICRVPSFDDVHDTVPLKKLPLNKTFRSWNGHRMLTARGWSNGTVFAPNDRGIYDTTPLEASRRPPGRQRPATHWTRRGRANGLPTLDTRGSRR